MTTLSGCIKKAGKSLNKSDADAIKSSRDELREDGLDPQQAAIEAVVGHMQSLLAEHGELTSDASYLPSTPAYDAHIAPVASEDSASTEKPVATDDEATVDAPREVAAVLPEPKKQTDTPAATEPAQRIEDFGERLEGARKDYASKLDAAKQADTIKVTLAESWPEPDYQKLLDSGIPVESVALVRAMRDEIPSKPRKSWKLRGWAEKVETLRDFAGDMLSGRVDAKMVRDKMEGAGGLEKVGGRADLYQEFGHGRSLKGVTFSKVHWDLYHGQKNVTLWMVERGSTAASMSNMPHTLAKGETRERAIEAFRKVYSKLDDAATKKAVQFDIYTNRETKEVFIGKKIGRNVVPVKHNLESVKAAREYLANNQDDLEQALAKIKEIPSHRKETNSPRVGANHRSNGDVSPEEFSEAFGFRGVQFGNYVEQDKRQQDLNRAYDALMDLAGILGIPSRALSLNGELGLAFGARGRGGKDAAAAHYEPDTVVINLTKQEGAGNIGHEWFHALDNYFSRDRGAKSGDDYATEGRSASVTRPEVAEAMRNIIQTITRTGIKERSRKLDKAKIKAYWTADREMAARAFESYVIEKLNDHGASNDYLANIVSEDYWEAAAALGMENKGSYPYPQAAEIPDIRAAFDNLFGVIESRETADGVMLFSKSAIVPAGATPKGMPVGEVQDRVDKFLKMFKGADDGLQVRVHRTQDGAFGPDARQRYGLIKAGFSPNGNTLDIVAENVISAGDLEASLRHEIFVHKGLGLFTQEKQQELIDLILREVPASKTLAPIWEKVQKDYHDKSPRVQAEELLAAVAESKYNRLDRAWINIVNWLRDALIKVGLIKPGLTRGALMEVVYEMGEAFRDGRQARERQAGQFLQTAHHGSPHRHDKFSTDKIGTGEGTQAYGWGLYFAQKRDVAEYYRNMTADQEGQLYTVDVPENDELLDWDAPLSAQSPAVKNALSRVLKDVPEDFVNDHLKHKNIDIEKLTGEDIYTILERVAYDDKLPDTSGMLKSATRLDEMASKYLKSIGIPGLRFFDHVSRHQPPPVPAFDAWAGYYKGADLDAISDAEMRDLRDEYDEFVNAEDTRTRNFVIFDDERIDITGMLFRAEDDKASTRRSRNTSNSGQGGISYSYTAGGVAQPPAGNPPTRPPGRTRAAAQPHRATIRDRLDAIRFQMQDKLIDLKRIQEDADPADDANAYQKAAIWEGKAGERLNDFDEERVQPLLQAIANSGVSWDDVGEWLVARHAKEANAYLAEINPDMDPAKRYRLSGMTDTRADSLLAQHAGNRNLAAVGNLVDQINRERVDLLVTDGLISQGMADAWQSRYQHYVPLKREEADGTDLLPARGKGFSVRGKESKMRTGSADWTPGKIVANTLAQHEASIVRAEKNKVGLALLEFIRSHPDDSFWDVDTDRTMKSVRNGKVVEGAKFADSPNELSVKEDGVEHVIVFNPGNPRAVRLVTGMKNLQAAEMGSVMRAMATVTRFLATINTSWNPEFMVSNFARDVQTAAYNLSDTDIADMRGRVIKDIPAAMNGIRSALFGDGSSSWAGVWEEFRKNGGKTGWLDIHGDVKKKEEDLQKMAARLAEGKPSRGQIERFLKGVEGMNNVIENGVRLSAYKNALDAGLSEDRAAALAKDLTVNFNRKGNMGSTLNALYMFYNAAVQGNVRLIQAMANSKQGRKLAFASIGFAVVLDVLNRSLSGDDDDGEDIYDTLPDYVKDRNIILMGAKEPIVKIPAPWGYNVLHVIGQIIGQAMTGEKFNALDSAARVGLSFIDAFNPVGSGTIAQVISPTVTDLIVQMAENKNFAGNPLKPEHTFDSRVPKPEYLMHWSTSREASNAIAKFLNDASGGNEVRPGKINISPEWLDLILDTVTGGLGATVANTLDTASRLVSGKEIPPENIPFVRKVTGYNNDQGLKGRYYEWSKGVAYAKSEAKTLRGDDLAEARKNPEYQLIPLYTGTEKQLTGMRKLRRQLVERGADDEKIEQLDERIRKVMARFNKAYAEKVIQ